MDNISFRISRCKKWYHGFVLKRTYLLLLSAISALLILITKYNSWISEYVFTRGIYHILSQGISLVTGVLPFSIMEATILLIPVIILVYSVWLVISLIKVKSNKNSYERFVKQESYTIGYYLMKQLNNILCVASVVIFLYTLLCGVNYNRKTFEDISGLQIEASTTQELHDVLYQLSLEVSTVRDELTHMGVMDETGVVTYSKEELKELGVLIQKEFKGLNEDYNVFSGTYGRFKAVNFSKFMSRMEVTGIYWPFTVEASVNMDASSYSIPATIAHEMAHQRGFMREDEANFIAYLVCASSDDPRLRYSGLMLALIYGTNQLYKYDVNLYEHVVKNFNEEILLDLRAEYYYWKQFEDTVISTVSTKMNDTYLKANSQEDGVKSYGRMIDLLIAYHKKEG